MVRRLAILAPAAALALSVYAVGLPFYAESPGPAKNVLPRIDVDGRTTYQPDGRLLLTTVNLQPVNLYGALAAWLDPAARLVPEREILPPGVNDQEYSRISRSQMDESKVAAVAAALERLTGYPKEHARGVVVQDTVPGSPADGRLAPGDLITEIDGEPVQGVAAFRRAVLRAGPGTTLTLAVEPVEGGDRGEIRVRPARIPGEEHPVVGVVLVANWPFQVRIHAGSVTGPSAGLMWALGVTDVLTPGDLTGGRTVAGTGEVDPHGNVGAIGGVRLKVAAAADAGADVFLVPRGNVAEARGATDGIELVPVSTLDQAVRYLEGGG